jgi:hypothetical protein
MTESDNTEQRLASLERFAEAVTTRQDGEDQLQQGVTRLSDETSALNSILTKVDAQQQQLRDLDKGKASKTDLEEVEKRDRHERKQNLLKTYRLLSGAMLISIMGIIGGAQLTDYHFQQCVLHGPNNSPERNFCNTIFPGHDHPEDLSLDSLLESGDAQQIAAIKNSRRGCERTQLRVQAEIDRSLILAQVDTPTTRPAHAKAATALKASLVNCEEEYPLPEAPK